MLANLRIADGFHRRKVIAGQNDALNVDGVQPSWDGDHRHRPTVDQLDGHPRGVMFGHTLDLGNPEVQLEYLRDPQRQVIVQN
jgi:hypothetical protein